jgi:hypothetical protein
VGKIPEFKFCAVAIEASGAAGGSGHAGVAPGSGA